MEITAGQVLSIRYTNPDNGFTVALIYSDKFGDTDIVGIMPGLSEGLTIEATGEWEENSKWGRQFKVKSYRSERPTDDFGLQLYLENVIGGIGPHLSELIVQKFGPLTTEKMSDPKALRKVKGIGKETASVIAANWTRHENERSVMQEIYGFLGQFDISTTYARKLFVAYGFDAVETLQRDPYKLMTLDRVAFLKADAVAKAMGIKADDPRRIRAALTHVITESTKFGHCFITKDNLIETVARKFIHNVEQCVIEIELNTLVETYQDIIEENEAIYPQRLYKAEIELAKRLIILDQEEARAPIRTFTLLSDREIRDRLPDDLNYTDQQFAAIINGLKNRISIITGGPGTGKSTIIKGLVDAAMSTGSSVILMAPTGLAAKRMASLAGHDAATVHRTLGVDPVTHGFICNHKNPLWADLCIIDESSMLDIQLANSLIDAIRPGCGVVFVGDVDQLPSVGPGNVLRNLIEVEVFPVTRLTEIFRQAKDSLIIPNAHAINEGRMPDFSKNADGDFFLFPAHDTQKAGDWVIELVTKRIPDGLGIPADDIRVLSPQKKTGAGVYALNKRLQAVLNPPHPDKAELKHGDRTFRVGDRVLRVAKNDYNRMIVNGDQGKVVLVDNNDTGKPRLWVKLDDRANGKEDTFDFVGEDIRTLRHGWALTIHKAQGLEFRAAVVVVLMAHYRMLVRNLLYTGVTRAREKVVLVGNQRAIGVAIQNDHVERRATRLWERIISEHNARGVTR